MDDWSEVPTLPDAGPMEPNFDRAANVVPLRNEYGDPERWGGTRLVLGGFAANFTGDLVLETTGQLVRAQAAELMARQWLVLATYEIQIMDPANSGLVTLSTIDLSITWGVGQVSMGGAARIFPVPLNAASAWTGAATAAAGVIDVGNVTGSAVSVLKARVTFHDAGAPQAVKVRARVSVAVAPRAV